MISVIKSIFLIHPSLDSHTNIIILCVDIITIMLTLPVDMSYFAIKGAGVCHQTMNKKTNSEVY